MMMMRLVDRVPHITNIRFISPLSLLDYSSPTNISQGLASLYTKENLWIDGR